MNTAVGTPRQTHGITGTNKTFHQDMEWLNHEHNV